MPLYVCSLGGCEALCPETPTHMTWKNTTNIEDNYTTVNRLVLKQNEWNLNTKIFDDLVMHYSFSFLNLISIVTYRDIDIDIETQNSVDIWMFQHCICNSEQ